MVLHPLGRSVFLPGLSPGSEQARAAISQRRRLTKELCSRRIQELATELRRRIITT